MSHDYALGLCSLGEWDLGVLWVLEVLSGGGVELGLRLPTRIRHNAQVQILCGAPTHLAQLPCVRCRTTIEHVDVEPEEHRQGSRRRMVGSCAKALITGSRTHPVLYVGTSRELPLPSAKSTMAGTPSQHRHLHSHTQVICHPTMRQPSRGAPGARTGGPSASTPCSSSFTTYPLPLGTGVELAQFRGGLAGQVQAVPGIPGRIPRFFARAEQSGTASF